MKHKHNTASQIHAHHLLLILGAKTGVFLMKMRINVFKFLLSLEGHSVYYSNEKQLLYVCFCLTAGLYKFYHRSDQTGIPCIKCVLKNTFSKLIADTLVLK